MYTVADFALWLEVGLIAYLSDVPEESDWAFEPLASFIGQDDDVILDLRNIYAVLSPIKKTYFRKAVADILNGLDAAKENIDLFENLLGLSRVLPAKTEILRVLASRIGNGYFGLLEGKDGENLFHATFLTVADLSVESAEAKDCLYKLIQSNNFDCAYAGLALEALCRADIENLVSHIKLLRAPLNSMFKKYGTSPAAKRSLVKKILKRVGLEPLVKALPALHFCDPYNETLANENWIALALINHAIGEEPLVKVEEHSNGGYEVYQPGKEYIRIQLKEPPDASMPWVIHKCAVKRPWLIPPRYSKIANSHKKHKSIGSKRYCSQNAKM